MTGRSPLVSFSRAISGQCPACGAVKRSERASGPSLREVPGLSNRQEVSTMSSSTTAGERCLLGIDFGTESCRAGVFDSAGRCMAAEATTYELEHPRPGWAEQDPNEWWSALVESVGKAMRSAGVGGDSIAGLCLDATTCTVVALDGSGRHLRPAIMWMDVRGRRSGAPHRRVGASRAQVQRRRPGFGQMAAVKAAVAEGARARDLSGRPVLRRRPRLGDVSADRPTDRQHQHRRGPRLPRPRQRRVAGFVL
jgi:hypothetical protein